MKKAVKKVLIVVLAVALFISAVSVHSFVKRRTATETKQTVTEQPKTEPTKTEQITEQIPQNNETTDIKQNIGPDIGKDIEQDIIQKVEEIPIIQDTNVVHSNAGWHDVPTDTTTAEDNVSAENEINTEPLQKPDPPRTEDATKDADKDGVCNAVETGFGTDIQKRIPMETACLTT